MARLSCRMSLRRTRFQGGQRLELWQMALVLSNRARRNRAVRSNSNWWMRMKSPCWFRRTKWPSSCSMFKTSPKWKIEIRAKAMQASLLWCKCEKSRSLSRGNKVRKWMATQSRMHKMGICGHNKTWFRVITTLEDRWRTTWFWAVRAASILLFTTTTEEFRESPLEANRPTEERFRSDCKVEQNF